MRGRPPKPTALKVLTGNPGKRRLNDQEPVPPPGTVEPSADLSPEGRIVWDHLAPICVGMGTLTTADLIAFERHCENVAREKYLRGFLRKNGGTYTQSDESGKLKYVGEIPQVSEHKALQKTLRADESRFGLDPASRSRIRIERGAAPPSAVAQSADDAKREAYFTPRLASGA